MLDIFLKIYGLVKDGLNFYKDKRKSSFSHELEPALKDFESIHKDYVDSLKGYLDIIRQNENELNIDHPILEKLNDDALFTDSLRQKLYSFYDNNNNPRVLGFNQALHTYFRQRDNILKYNYKLDLERELRMNIPRQELYHGIYYILSNDMNDPRTKRKQVEKQIKFIMSNLQQQYRKVIDEYYQAKESLLSW